MAKLRRDVLENFITVCPTSKEIDFLIYVCQYQDETALAKGIFYKTACEEIGCCKQTFYNIIDSLQRKGIIKVIRESEVDYDIQIIGNEEFKTDEMQYLYARTPVLHSKKFRKLPPFAKLMAIDLILQTKANAGKWKIGQKKFMERYKSEFFPEEIKKKTLQEYVRKLRDLFYFQRAKNVTDGLAAFVIIPKKLEGKRPHNDQSDSHLYTRNVITAFCRRLKIKHYSKESLADTAELITQYRLIAKDLRLSIYDILNESILKSINRSFSLKLNPKLVHKYVRNVLFGESVAF